MPLCLQAALADPSKPGDVVMKLEELLAYAASPGAVDAMLSLELDYGRPAERLLPMALSNAVGRENSFDLAYLVLDKGSDGAKEAVFSSPLMMHSTLPQSPISATST